MQVQIFQALEIVPVPLERGRGPALYCLSAGDGVEWHDPLLRWDRLPRDRGAEWRKRAQLLHGAAPRNIHMVTTRKSGSYPMNIVPPPLAFGSVSALERPVLACWARNLFR